MKYLERNKSKRIKSSVIAIGLIAMMLVACLGFVSFYFGDKKADNIINAETRVNKTGTVYNATVSDIYVLSYRHDGDSHTIWITNVGGVKPTAPSLPLYVHASRTDGYSKMSTLGTNGEKLSGTSYYEMSSLGIAEGYSYSIYCMISDGISGAQTTNTITIYYGDRVEVELPDDPIVSGYTFDGWFYDAEFTQSYNGEQIFEDTALYAKLTPILYTITYNLNNGTLTGQTTSYTIESANITLKSPSRTGYTFGGWYESSSFGGNAVTAISTGSIGNKTYYAKWTVNTYSITYNSNGGTLSGQEASYTVETSTFSLKTPVRLGYTFGGWFENSDFSGSATSGITKGTTGNRTYYAKWTVTSYSITYELNSGWIEGERTNYTIESSIFALVLPERGGYNFLGWYAKSDFSGSPVSEVVKGSTENKTFYARWEIKKYNVNFYVAGELYKSIIVEHGTALVDLYVADTQSLQEVKFSSINDMTQIYDNSIGITEDISLYTTDAFSLYATLTYIFNGHTATEIMEYGATLDNLRIVERSGYTFEGWFYDEDYRQAVSGEDKLTNNTTIHAKFVKITDATDTDKTLFEKISPFLLYGGIGLASIFIIAVIIVAIKRKR